MYTVIIPTMFKSPRINKLVDDLHDCEFVDEIILIDNTENTSPVFDLALYPKINYINELRNTGVNPAWNKGVKLAKNELICIASDDINFDPNIMGVLTSEVITSAGIIGMDFHNFDDPFLYQDAPYIENWWPGKKESGGGWGCLLFLKKSMWYEIPEDIIIWCGDNFIREINPTQKSILKGFEVNTEMSTTSDLPEFDEIKNRDVVTYHEYMKKFFIQSIAFLSWHSPQLINSQAVSAMFKTK